MFKIFFNVLRRDLQICFNRKNECLSLLLIYIMIVSLFPLAAGQIAPQQLWIVPCLIWIAVLLTNTLGQERLFKSDYILGVLDQFILSPASLPALITAKIFAHWLMFSLPLVLVTPLLGILFNIPFECSVILTLSLLLGTPILSSIGAIASALTVTINGGGVLLTLLLLPLYIPILVLGASAGILSLQGMAVNGQLSLLAALAIASLLTAPFMVSTAIKASAA